MAISAMPSSGQVRQAADPHIRQIAAKFRRARQSNYAIKIYGADTYFAPARSLGKNRTSKLLVKSDFAPPRMGKFQCSY
jgi:hypothetical protein